jgi:hypothetical protein
VHVGQLDRVPDLLDLVGQPTDVFVGDVRHLFENQLFDLGTLHLLQYQAGLGVDPDVIAGS